MSGQDAEALALIHRTSRQGDAEQALVSPILHATNDGDDLSPEHLFLLQLALNRNLNDEGRRVLRELHQQATTGQYRRPWLFGIEHLTQDLEGFVYWKGQEVEHYSCRDEEGRQRLIKAAHDLARRCRIVEGRGEPVNSRSVIWNWKEPEGEAG